MKKIYLIIFILLSCMTFGEGYDFDEIAKDSLEEEEVYRFSIENIKLDINNDGIKEIIKFDKKIPNTVIINGIKFQPTEKLSIESFSLAKKNNKVYIGFEYRPNGEIYATKAYIFDGKRLLNIPKDTEKEELEIELNTQIKAIENKIKKETIYDYYIENNITPEECESSVYTISYDDKNNIVSVWQDSLSLTGESALSQTQYYENGIFKYLKLTYYSMYSGTTEIISEINNDKIESYVLHGENELNNIMYDTKIYDDQYYETTKSFLINNQFVNPRDSISLNGFIDDYFKAVMGDTEVFEKDTFRRDDVMTLNIKDFIKKLDEKSMYIHNFEILSTTIKEIDKRYQVELLVKYNLIYADLSYELYTVISFLYSPYSWDSGYVYRFEEKRVKPVDLDYKAIDEIFGNKEAELEKIKALEEEGLQKITQYIPSELSVETYSEYLFEYADLLIANERYKEAFPLLIRIMQLPYENKKIYLSLGDCYGREYETSKSKLDFEGMYENYFKYSNLLDKKEKLPKRVTEILKKNVPIQLVEADKHMKKVIVKFLEKQDPEYSKDMIELYGKEEEFYGAYHDLNNDGIPELLAFITSPARSGSRSNGNFIIYSLKNNKIEKEIFEIYGLFNYTANNTFFTVDANPWKTVKINTNYGYKFANWNGKEYSFDVKEENTNAINPLNDLNKLKDFLSEMSSMNKGGTGLIKNPISWGDSYENFDIDYEYYTMNQLIKYDDCFDSIFIDANNPSSLGENVSVSIEIARDACNRLSKKYNLPLAYSSNDKLMDEFGNETTDVKKVKGFRLITMEEWLNSVLNNREFKEWDDKQVEFINYSDDRVYAVGAVGGKKDKESLNIVERYDLNSEFNFRIVLTKF